MGGTDRAPEPKGESTAPAPASQRRPAHESKIFQQPSSFTSRRAEREAAGPAPGQRLVSLGWSEQPLVGRTSEDVEMIELELLYDLDHPSRRYYRVRNGTLEPLFDDRRRDQRTPLGRVPRKPRGLPSSFPEAASEPPPRPTS